MSENYATFLVLNSPLSSDGDFFFDPSTAVG